MVEAILKSPICESTNVCAAEKLLGDHYGDSKISEEWANALTCELVRCLAAHNRARNEAWPGGSAIANADHTRAAAMQILPD